MKAKLESIILVIQSVKQQVRDAKPFFVEDIHQADEIEDVDMALAWILKKLDRLQKE